MLAIKGVGRDTVVDFFAEVGDLNDYPHPRQIIKLAGLSLKENTSGKHKGTPIQLHFKIIFNSKKH